jgi:hypothetical protein
MNSDANANLQEHTNAGERGLWTAVLLQAIEDWDCSNLRLKREAEGFLLQNSPDFNAVCRSAGLVPNSVLVRLQQKKELLKMEAISHA